MSARTLPFLVRLQERGWRVALAGATLLSVLALLWPLLTVVAGGVGVLSPEFLLSGPRDAGRAGGILPILVSTGWVVLISLAAALPLALAVAVLMTEVFDPAGRIAVLVRCSLDVLAGVPSVVFGLFGLSLFCRQLGWGYSIAAGGATLACMILPTLARAFTSALEAVGTQHRMAGLALGLTRAAVLWRVTVPVALPGLCAALMLALTRALAETALLLFTSGYSDRMPTSMWDSGRTVSVHIYDLSTNVPGGLPRSYGSALVLLLLLAAASFAVHAATRWMQRRMTGGAPAFAQGTP